MATMRLVSLCALLAALAVCGSPNPRGSYDQGVAVSRDSAPSPYYTGADPSFRPKGGGGP